MSVALDERAQRRARLHAAAAHIAARGRSGPLLVTPSSQVLRPSPRRRLHAGDEPRPRARRRADVWAGRRAAVTVLALQLAALAAVLALPVFIPRDVNIDGAGFLTDASLMDAAAVPAASIFTIDGDAIRERVQAVPLVRSVTVTTELPARVHISVTEWKPVLRLVVGGHNLLIAENGAAVDVATVRPDAAPRVPVVLDGRPASPAGAHGEGLDPRLVELMQSTAAHFPAVFGCSVAAFQWQPDGLLSIWSDRGWRAILGHVDTGEQVAAVPAQLAALAALRGQLNLAAPGFGYVNLESTDSLAVGGTPGLPAEVAAAAPSPLPAGTAAIANRPPPAASPTAPAEPAPSPPPASPPALRRPAASSPVMQHAITRKPGPAPPQPAAASPPGGQPYIVYIPQGGGH